MNTKPTLYRTEKARHTVLTFENVSYMKTKTKKWKISGQAKTNSDSATWNHHNLQQSAWKLVPKSVTESSTLLNSMCTNTCKDTRQALLVDFLFAKRQEMLRLRIPAFHSVPKASLVYSLNILVNLLLKHATTFLPSSSFFTSHPLSPCPSLSQQSSQAFPLFPLSTTKKLERVPQNSAQQQHIICKSRSGKEKV